MLSFPLIGLLTCFGIKMFLTFRSTLGKWPFRLSTGEVSAQLRMNITPADWTFYIVWSSIYLWQLLWIAYYVASYSIESAPGQLLADWPKVLPDQSIYWYMVVCLCNSVWLIVWDRRHLWLSVIFIIGIWISLLATLWHSYEHLAVTESLQSDSAQELIVWLIQNGLGLYAGWLCVAWPLNFAIALCHSFGMSVERASALGMYLIAAELVLLFVADNWLMTRGRGVLTFAPYAPIVFGLIGSLAKNYRPRTDRHVSMLISIVFVLAVTLVTLRLARCFELDVY